ARATRSCSPVAWAWPSSTRSTPCGTSAPSWVVSGRSPRSPSRSKRSSTTGNPQPTHRMPNRNLTQDVPTARGRIVPAPDVPATVRTFFECLNTEDFERLAELWTASAELAAVGSRARRGLDDIMAYYRPLFGPWAEHRDEPTRVIVAGDTVV